MSNKHEDSERPKAKIGKKKKRFYQKAYQDGGILRLFGLLLQGQLYT